MSGDYVERLRSMLDRDPDRFLSTEEGDLCAALDELERLRAAGAGDSDEPQESGAVVAVNYGDYARQEIWVRSGANIGAWYLLGGEFGRVINEGIPRPPQHPHWEHVLARGPVTLLTRGDAESYRRGWKNGRRRLLEQMEGLD